VAPVSSRIIVASFKTKIMNIMMIQCYAPTMAAEEYEWEEFYEQVREVFRKERGISSY
jgi:hypothetical protein